MSDHETQSVTPDDAIRVIASFVWNLRLKRVLHDIDPRPRLNFWRVTQGDLLDMAVIEWCKLFGSHTEPTHWKQVVPETEHDEFRTGLAKAVGSQWEKYRKQVKEYRDGHAAHYSLPSLDPKVDERYPDLDMALKSDPLL